MSGLFCLWLENTIGRLVKWYNCGLQNRCRGFDSLIARKIMNPSYARVNIFCEAIARRLRALREGIEKSEHIQHHCSNGAECEDYIEAVSFDSLIARNNPLGML